MVLPAEIGVRVGIGLLITVGGIGVAVGVGVKLGVKVGVLVLVLIGVRVGVLVGVLLGVKVTVGVFVGVQVRVGEMGEGVTVAIGPSAYSNAPISHPFPCGLAILR